MQKAGCHIFLLFFLFQGFPSARAQGFIFGSDLSYVNQMEDCGAVYKEDMQPKDPYQIFADHGTNLVRVRLWLDPSWWQAPLNQPPGVKPWYNDLEDVKETIQRAKAAGMQVMLDLHYSDFWADPGRQLIPRAWLDVAYDLEALKDTVYNYTFALLSGLDAEGLMPDFVKVGNETNPGILKHIPSATGYDIIATVSNNWSRHGQLFNAAIQAIRDVGQTASIDPKIAVHFTGSLSGQKWNFQNLLNAGVSDFDIMGFSYYYAWHEGSIAQLRSTVQDLVEEFPGYEIMAVEMGYLWSTQNFDPLGNIITEPDPQYLPVCPEKQLEYMIDYTRAVMKGGGTGVIFWEPAWVSTPCKTPWGTGSSHDHVAFFDPADTNFMENGGGVWPEAPYYEDLNTHKATFKVDMTGQDVSNGVFISGTFTGGSGQFRPMFNVGGGVYAYYTYLPAGEEGGYFYLNGNDLSFRETVPAECADWMGTDRKYQIPGHDITYSDYWGSCGPSAAEETLAEDQVCFHPNPASDSIFPDCPGCAEPATVFVLNLNGRAVKIFESVKSGELLDVSDLPDGLYFLKWMDGDRTITQKIFFQKI